MTRRTPSLASMLLLCLTACGMGGLGYGEVLGSAPYPDGEWDGVFNMKYVDSTTGTVGAHAFHVNLHMHLLVSDGVTASYVVDDVATTDPYFGCAFGCTLSFTDGAVNLPVRTGGSSAPDEYSWGIVFPNGAELYANGTVFTNTQGISFASDPGSTPDSRFLVSPPPGGPSYFAPPRVPTGSSAVELTWTFNYVP